MKPKGDPIPVRFDGPEGAAIKAISRQTGLSQAEIIRRAGRFAFPKFQSGEVSLTDFPPHPVEVAK